MLLLKPINLLRKMQKTDGYWWSHQPGTIPIQYYPKSKDFLSWTWFLHILQNLQQISFSPNHVTFSSVFCFFISHSIFLQEFSISIAAACLYFTYGSYQLYLHSLSLVQIPPVFITTCRPLSILHKSFLFKTEEIHDLCLPLFQSRARSMPWAHNQSFEVVHFMALHQALLTNEKNPPTYGHLLKLHPKH